MIAIKNVLVATDFSPVSETALVYGRALARTFNGTLHVLHVVDNLAARFSYADPAVAGVVPADRALFGQDLVRGKVGAEQGHDGLFGAHVHLGDEVGCPLEADALYSPVRLAEHVAAGPGRGRRHFDNGGEWQIGHQSLDLVVPVVGW